MKTTWEFSLQTEVSRVVDVAKSIATGFFRLNNFYILPKINRDISGQCVVFPDLNYQRIPRFWEKVRVVKDETFPIKVSKVLAEGVGNILAKRLLRKPEFDVTRKLWDTAQSEILQAIFDILPSKKGLLKEVIIYPTVFGTTCSFSYFKDGKIYIYLREDQGVYAISEAILTSLTRVEIFEDLGGSWSESELLVDFLLTKSKFSRVLKKFSPESTYFPTLKSIRVKQSAKICKESERFYDKLGLPQSENVFGLGQKTPTVFGKPVNNLTLTEKLILELLIKKANSVISFDDLGNVLFDRESDFSLYAITKSMQRVRDKLEENGVSGSYIQTLRGQGYLLKN